MNSHESVPQKDLEKTTAANPAWQRLMLFLKGMAMGAADVVPGVSGGTIALISGIYQELLESISKVELQALQILFKQGLPAAWKYINGWFLLVLFSGIVTSAVLLSHAILFLLSNYPIPVWSFFFGLIIASSVFVGATITHWRPVVSYLLLGVVVGYLLTEIAPVEAEFSYPYLFMSGAIAICAMILPGISGSFILLMLGMYVTVLSAVKGLDIPVILVFCLGCLAGLMAFSKLLSWLLNKAYNITMALLLGLMIGSLNRVWPWKEVLAYQIKTNGDQVAISHRNLLPMTYSEITGNDAELVVAICMAIVGLIVVFLPTLIARNSHSR